MRWTLASISAMLLAAVAWAMAKTRTGPAFETACSAAVVATLLIAYHSNHADLSLAALPLCVSVAAAMRRKDGGSNTALYLGVGLFWMPVTYIAMFLTLPLPLVVLPLLLFLFYLLRRTGAFVWPTAMAEAPRVPSQ